MVHVQLASSYYGIDDHVNYYLSLNYLVGRFLDIIMKVACHEFVRLHFLCLDLHAKVMRLES